MQWGEKECKSENVLLAQKDNTDEMNALKNKLAVIARLSIIIQKKLKSFKFNQNFTFSQPVLFLQNKLVKDLTLNKLEYFWRSVLPEIHSLT